MVCVAVVNDTETAPLAVVRWENYRLTLADLAFWIVSAVTVRQEKYAQTKPCSCHVGVLSSFNVETEKTCGVITQSLCSILTTVVGNLSKLQ